MKYLDGKNNLDRKVNLGHKSISAETPKAFNMDNPVQAKRSSGHKNIPISPSPVGVAQSTTMQHRYAAHNMSSEPIPCAVAHGYNPISANALSYDEKNKRNIKHKLLKTNNL
jgi:hypothetical protein